MRTLATLICTAPNPLFAQCTIVKEAIDCDKCVLEPVLGREFPLTPYHGKRELIYSHPFPVS